MKIWTSQHVFEHPWATVVMAAHQKYPNPMNPNVVGIDVVDRFVDTHGVLRSKRLMCTAWGMPSWVLKVFGSNKVCYISEHMDVDPFNKVMTLKSRNLTFSNIITFDESLTYKSHPDDNNKTLLCQEATMRIDGVPLSSFMESALLNSVPGNANKGRQAIEWVIERLKSEATDLRSQIRLENILSSST